MISRRKLIAGAGGLILPQLIVPKAPAFLADRVRAGAGGGPYEFNYIGKNDSTSNLTTYTFSSASIGTPYSDRIVIVGVHGNGINSATISSVTIGGNTASIQAQVSLGDTTAGIASLKVPAGTTADIVVTFSSGKGNCTAGVWTLTGNGGNATADETDTDTSAGTTTTCTVTGGSDHFGVSVCVSGNISATSWTGSGDTEEYDFDPEPSGGGRYSAITIVNPAGNYTAVGGSFNSSQVLATWTR